jgi:hypothetical protein
VQRDKLKTDHGGHGQKIAQQLLRIENRIAAGKWKTKEARFRFVIYDLLSEMAALPISWGGLF